MKYDLKINEDLASYNFDINKLSSSIYHYEKALMIAQEIDNSLKEMYICEELGKIYLKMNREENYESACVYFHQVLTLSQQLRNIDAILRFFLY